MNTAFDILVIILSSFLAIFIFLAIIATVLMLKLIQSLRHVVAKGEHLVDSAEAIGETLRRNAGAVSLLKIMARFMGTVNNSRRRD